MTIYDDVRNDDIEAVERNINTDSTIFPIRDNKLLLLSKSLEMYNKLVNNNVTEEVDNSVCIELCKNPNHNTTILTVHTNDAIERYRKENLMYIATVNNHYEAVKVLLNYPIYTKECMREAVKSGNLDLVNLFIDVGNWGVNEESSNLLHIAANNGDLEMVILLMCQDIDLAYLDEYGRTAINIAEINGNYDIVTYIENASEKFEEHYDVLEYVKSGNLDKVKMIIHDGNVNQIFDEKDVSYLSTAVKNSKISIITYLLTLPSLRIDNSLLNNKRFLKLLSETKYTYEYF